MFNKGTLLKGVLIPELLNIPIACCSLINLNFLLSQFAQFDCIINLFCLFLIVIISACNYFKHSQNFISACNYFKH